MGSLEGKLPLAPEETFDLGIYPVGKWCGEARIRTGWTSPNQAHHPQARAQTQTQTHNVCTHTGLPGFPEHWGRASSRRATRGTAPRRCISPFGGAGAEEACWRLH